MPIPAATDAAARRRAPTGAVLLLILIAAAMDVAGQVFYKSGINRMPGMTGSPFTSWALIHFAWNAVHNWRVLLGIAISCGQAAPWWGALSRVDLSYAAPLASVGYIFLLGASHLFLNESISVHRWVGTIAVVFGVCLITRTSPITFPIRKFRRRLH
ncbi:MAG: EamA family transporter [Terriglobales bacterium]